MSLVAASSEEVSPPLSSSNESDDNNASFPSLADTLSVFLADVVNVAEPSPVKKRLRQWAHGDAIGHVKNDSDTDETSRRRSRKEEARDGDYVEGKKDDEHERSPKRIRVTTSSKIHRITTPSSLQWPPDTSNMTHRFRLKRGEFVTLTPEEAVPLAINSFLPDQVATYRIGTSVEQLLERVETEPDTAKRNEVIAKEVALMEKPSAAMGLLVPSHRKGEVTDILIDAGRCSARVLQIKKLIAAYTTRYADINATIGRYVFEYDTTLVVWTTHRIGQENINLMPHFHQYRNNRVHMFVVQTELLAVQHLQLLLKHALSTLASAPIANRVFAEQTLIALQREAVNSEAQLRIILSQAIVCVENGREYIAQCIKEVKKREAARSSMSVVLAQKMLDFPILSSMEQRIEYAWLTARHRFAALVLPQLEATLASVKKASVDGLVLRVELDNLQKNVEQGSKKGSDKNVQYDYARLLALCEVERGIYQFYGEFFDQVWTWYAQTEDLGRQKMEDALKSFAPGAAK